MDRPWWKFCGRDWLGDLDLHRCSVAARGLWIEMLCLMNEGVPYGHLADKKGAIKASRLAHVAQIRNHVCEKLMKELEDNSVFSKTDGGVIFSRRMVRDEAERLKAQERMERFKRGKERVVLPVRNGVRNGEKNAVRASDSDSDSDSEKKNKVTPAENSLAGEYMRLVEAWPDDRRGVDLGAQVWISLVDSGEITAAGLQEVFAGLERWKLSELWQKSNGKYIPAIANPQGTGWLQKRAWKDHPKPAATEENW